MHRMLGRVMAAAGGLAMIGVLLTGQPAVAADPDPGPRPVQNPNRLAADFDGDGRADAVVWRPSTGTFYVERFGADGSMVIPLGKAGDVPMPADYTGDGKADAAVWRPSDHTFYYLRSDNGVRASASLGATGDIPVNGDYDGDGTSDFTLYRPSTQEWMSKLSKTSTVLVRKWGLSEIDEPVAGDYDGDGKADLAVWRPGYSEFLIQRSSDGGIERPGCTVGAYCEPAPLDADGDGATDGAVLFSGRDFWSWEVLWPLSTKVSPHTVPGGSYLVPGDYDGDGKDDFGVWRSQERSWDISRSSNALVTQYGERGDLPFALDFDGDGKVDRAVWRPSNHTWYILRSKDGGQTIRSYGAETDIPVPADYDGDGKVDIATYRPVSGLWGVIRSSDGQPQYDWYAGNPGDVPVPGDYDGDQKADRAVWNPKDGYWGIKQSTDGQSRGQKWGQQGDKPLIGDVDGDGKQDLVVARQFPTVPSEPERNGTTEFHILPSGGGAAEVRSTYGAGVGKTPQRLADVDGDRKADPVRGAGQVWFTATRSGQPPVAGAFGEPDWYGDDVPVIGDYFGDRRADYAYFRREDATWHVQKDPAKEKFRATQGAAGDIPLG